MYIRQITHVAHYLSYTVVITLIDREIIFDRENHFLQSFSTELGMCITKKRNQALSSS